MTNHIFISYAHEDVRWRDEFERMLAPARERGLIEVWSDGSIAAGEDWKRNIQRALESSRVGLLLVTDFFFSSEFITKVELANLLTAAKSRGVSIRWVPISPCLYDLTDLEGFQACWNPEKSLDGLSDAERKAAIRKICSEIVEDFGKKASKVSIGRKEEILNKVQKRLEEDRYIVTGEVALGKSSIVYRAQRRATGRTVAVKVFVESELDDWARRRFIEGTQRADELTSPAFIKIIDYFLEESPEFLVSEFIEGEPLSIFLQRYPQGLPLTKVKSILLDLMRAIEEAHDRGWGRGEICPSDILIDAWGLPRLSPFGFSNTLREQAQVTGNFLVDHESLAYMTPERFFGQESTKLTDQYSLGIIATELLGGIHIPRVVRPCDLVVKPDLFAELESGKGEWAKRSPQFKGVICRMLRTDPERRWPSMKVVANFLQQIQIEESPEELNRDMAMKSYLRFQDIEGERRFFCKFYENLFTTIPEVKVLFQSIDMERQHRLLNAAILTLLNFELDSSVAKANLEVLAARHANLGLARDEAPEVFVDALVQTIEELGENDPALLAAWRSALAPGIEFMWKTREK